MSTRTRPDTFDIITMQLINNYLSSVVDEMMQVVVRTSLSPITREVFDFQCGLCRGDGEMILEGEGTYIHSLVYQTLIRNWLARKRDDTFPGDVIITNDPYSDASHLPDLYIYRPIFLKDEIVAWAVGGGHQRDVGGMTPGSCPHNASEIHQEGLRIPPVKLYERGRPNETLFTILRAASRTPDIVVADVGAYTGACVIGEQRFRDLIDEHGWETLDMYLAELLDYTERLARAEIAAMPDGSFEFTDYLDDDGVHPDRPLAIHLKITVEGDRITYDFTGTAPQVKSGMNNPIGSVRSIVVTAMRSMMSSDIPRNGGAWRPAKLIVPKGSLLNPVPPGAVASRGGTSQRQSDVVLGCQVPIRPDRLMACSGGVDTLINIGGTDAGGEPFILTESCWGGWGAGPRRDGNDFMTPPSLNNSNTPCEVSEEMYPGIMYKEYGYVPDTEGAGTYRGSMAVVREWEYLGSDEAVLQLRVDRRQRGPYGLYGGHPGSPLKATINPGRAGERDVGKITTELKPGDSVRIQAAGAGGWGRPVERDPRLVLRDVRNGLVSGARARDVYGVVVREDRMEVDAAATRRRRSSMAKQN